MSGAARQRASQEARACIGSASAASASPQPCEPSPWDAPCDGLAPPFPTALGEAELDRPAVASAAARFRCRVNTGGNADSFGILRASVNEQHSAQ